MIAHSDTERKQIRGLYLTATLFVDCSGVRMAYISAEIAAGCSAGFRKVVLVLANGCSWFSGVCLPGNIIIHVLRYCTIIATVRASQCFAVGLTGGFKNRTLQEIYFVVFPLVSDSYAYVRIVVKPSKGELMLLEK